MRIPAASLLHANRTAEPAFSSVKLDESSWVKKAHGQGNARQRQLKILRMRPSLKLPARRSSPLSTAFSS